MLRYDSAARAQYNQATRLKLSLAQQGYMTPVCSQALGGGWHGLRLGRGGARQAPLALGEEGDAALR